MVHILGLAQGATEAGPWTVYVIDPVGNPDGERRLRRRPAPGRLRPGLDRDRPRARIPGRGPSAAPAVHRVRGRPPRSTSGSHAVRLAVPRRHRRRAHGGPAVPADPDPLQAPARRRPRRALRARGRDVLRPVPDRHERRLRGPVHHRGLHRLRRGLDGLVARPCRVLAGDAGHRRPARPRARLEVGGGLRHRGPDPADPRPQRPRARPRDPGPDRHHVRARLPGHHRARGPGLREPHVPDHDAGADPDRGRHRDRAPGRLDRRRDAARGRRAGGPRDARVLRRRRDRVDRCVDWRSVRWPSPRSRSPWPWCWARVSWRSCSGSAVGSASGRSRRRRRRTIPARYLDPPAPPARRLAAPRLVARPAGGLRRHLPRRGAGGRVRPLVHPVGHDRRATRSSPAGRPGTTARPCWT